MTSKKKSSVSTLLDSEKDTLNRFLDEVISGVACGKLHDLSYPNALEAVKYIYNSQNLETPFLVICENVFEMQVMKNVFTILFNEKEEVFLDKFYACVQEARGQCQVDRLEKMSAELYRYVLPLALKLLSIYTGISCVPDVSVPQTLRNFLFQVDHRSRVFFSSNCRELSALGMTSDYDYAFADVMLKKGVDIPQSVLALKKLKEESNIFSALTCEDVVFVCKYPKKVHFNHRNQLHCTKGVAVEVSASHPLFVPPYYFINGRYVRNYKLITEGFSAEDFIEEINEEDRAFMFEIVSERSPDAVIEFFDLVVVDEAQLSHIVQVPYFDANGFFVGEKTEVQKETITLYRTKQSFRGISDPLKPNSTKNKLAWIRFVCPSTGTNYMIYTSPSFKKAIDAAKHARAFQINTEYTWNYRS